MITFSMIYASMLEQMNLLVMLVIISSTLTLLIINKIRYKELGGIISFFDPLIITVFFSGISIITPIFMYLDKWMYRPEEFVFAALTTEFTFLFIILAFGKYRHNLIKEETDAISTQLRRRTLVLYLCLFILLKLIFYVQVGVPIFSDLYYTEMADKASALTRITNDISMVLYILWIDSYFYIRRKIYFWGIGGGLLLFLLLSAQKGAMMIVLYALFFVQLYRLKFSKSMININSRYVIIGVALVLFSALLPLIKIVISGSTFLGEMTPWEALIMRMFASGDSYPLFYGMEKVYKVFEEGDGIVNFIMANVSCFHFTFGYDTNLIPNKMLGDIVAPSGGFISPIITFNIIGHIICGPYYAWIYAAFISFFIGICTRYLVCKICNFNFFSYILFAQLYIGTVNFTNNYLLTINFESFLINGFILGLVLFLYKKVKM